MTTIQAIIQRIGNEYWAIRHSSDYNPFNQGYINSNKLARIDPESITIKQGDSFTHAISGKKHVCRGRIKERPLSGKPLVKIFISKEEAQGYKGIDATKPVWFPEDQLNKYPNGTLIKVTMEGNLATIISHE